jgi:hypothetical protein
MSPRPSLPGNRPVLISLCLMALAVLMAVAFAATAQAGQYKSVACTADSGVAYTTETNTISAQHPEGIFDFNNYCGGAGGDPPGDAAFIRIAEHEPNGSAGNGAYGRMIFATPWYVHFKAAGGYTRQPYAFNDGWRSRFWGLDFASNGTIFLNQGAGLSNSGTDRPSSNTFGPHLWPFTSFLDFHHFYFELYCQRPSGCDRTNYNATDANGFVFILNDDDTPDLYFTNKSSPLMQGSWVRGQQWMSWYVHDNGSGLRDERLRVDGTERYLIDYQALGQCSVTSSPSNGEYARTYQPCPGGPFDHSWTLDTTSLPDGAHNLSICAQDYGQYIGLNGTGGETCDSRTIQVDNTPPGAPIGLQIATANPNRYLDHFGAGFSLPPNSGSPIARLHYNVVNATGEVVVPEHTVSATEPTTTGTIEGPPKAGDYNLRVWLEDSVGLQGPAAVVPVPHDTTPPASPQGIAVTPPATPRSADGFDLRWHNVLDSGAPIAAARYQVLDGSGKIVVPTQAVAGDNPQAIAGLEVPGAAGSYGLRLWLEDAEGNVGAPTAVPLTYDCMRSPVQGGTQLTAGLAGQPSQTVQQGGGVILSGALRAADGSPVATAPVCIYSRVATDQGREFQGIALTDSAGGWRFPIPAGPSRELSAVYRPDQRQLRASAELHTVVHPTLRTPSAVIRNKSVARFEGEIPGPHNDDVTIVLQVKSGKGWLAFRRYRTRADGHYELEYPFRRTTRPTTYEMRAQVRETTGYPYEQGDSDPLILRVVPGRRKPVHSHSESTRRGCAKKARPRGRPREAHCHPKSGKARGAR